MPFQSIALVEVEAFEGVLGIGFGESRSGVLDAKEARLRDEDNTIIRKEIEKALTSLQDGSSRQGRSALVGGKPGRYDAR